jgi:hypothetical protein
VLRAEALAAKSRGVYAEHLPDGFSQVAIYRRPTPAATGEAAGRSLWR